ncbi:restriction endonuclease subunit S [Peptostreptococcus russellii]|uniref:restriction endonuclease subunit S n=1 Tax=Peptostreptococcus russellii TaxID=215200 RepID=UPI002942C06C|nr:restriction endonuclease subunit S [Peptostreptococcus russellii]
MSFKYTEIGKMPVEWDVKMIQEIGEVVSGGTPKTKEDSYWDGNISWITPKDLSSFTERYIEVGERSITELGLKNSSAKLLPKGTVLFSSRAPIGYLAIARKELCTNQGFKNIVCDKKYSSNEFLFYMLKAKKNEIESIAGGSTFKEVSGKVVKEFKIPIPPLNEQNAIAHILSTLDDKIEVNNQINKTLENMAQAIFKQWFVDFEFPNEDGEPYKSSGGEMVESELGLIPLGWKVHLLKDFVPVITGKKNANVATNSGKYKFFTCSQIASKTDDYSFEGKAILVAGNGDFNVKFYNGKFEAYQRTYVLIPHKEDLSGFIYYMMDYNLEEIVTNARGSVISYLTKGDLEDSKIAFPEKENHIQYTVIFQIINEFILNLNKENEKLSELRDTLLPKLMSGEIRVPLDSEGDVS